jgi:hypothetical protein
LLAIIVGLLLVFSLAFAYVHFSATIAAIPPPDQIPVP